MEFKRVEFTHTGWFLFCPIYINPNFENPEIHHRYHLSWLLDIAIVILNNLIVPLYALKAQHSKQPVWVNPICGIKELKKPVTFFVEKDADAS